MDSRVLRVGSGNHSWYDVDFPEVIHNTGFSFVKEHDMTPETMIEELVGIEKVIFKIVYPGKASRKLYRLYEYRSC